MTTGKTLEATVLEWLHTIKTSNKQKWIKLATLFEKFINSNIFHDNILKPTIFSFGRVLQSLSRKNLNEIQLFKNTIVTGRIRSKWVLILDNSTEKFYPNNNKYIYDNGDPNSNKQNHRQTVTHNPKADNIPCVDDSTTVPQTVYFTPEVCELDSTPNSQTFQTGIQHQQQQHESQSPPLYHHPVTPNQVTPPTDTTYTSFSPPSYDLPTLIERETIKNEEVDKMMSCFIQRMKIGAVDTNLVNFEEVTLTTKEKNNYNFLKMIRIPLVPKILQILLSEITQLSSSHPEYNIMSIQTSDISSKQLVMVPQMNNIDDKLNRPVKSFHRRMLMLTFTWKYHWDVKYQREETTSVCY